MSQDFSVFGWMLPEQEMDVLIIPVIISLIGYIILICPRFNGQFKRLISC